MENPQWLIYGYSFIVELCLSAPSALVLLAVVFAQVLSFSGLCYVLLSLLSILFSSVAVHVHFCLCSGVAIYSGLQILFHCCFVQLFVFLLQSVLLLSLLRCCHSLLSASIATCCCLCSGVAILCFQSLLRVRIATKYCLYLDFGFYGDFILCMSLLTSILLYRWCCVRVVFRTCAT